MRSLLKEQSETPVSPGLLEIAQLPGSVSSISLWENLGFYSERSLCVLVFSLPVSGVLNITLPQESEDCKTFPACGLPCLSAFQVDLFISEK